MIKVSSKAAASKTRSSVFNEIPRHGYLAAYAEWFKLETGCSSGQAIAAALASLSHLTSHARFEPLRGQVGGESFLIHGPSVHVWAEGTITAKIFDALQKAGCESLKLGGSKRASVYRGTGLVGEEPRDHSMWESQAFLGMTHHEMIGPNHLDIWALDCFLFEAQDGPELDSGRSKAELLEVIKAKVQDLGSYDLDGFIRPAAFNTLLASQDWSKRSGYPYAEFWRVERHAFLKSWKLAQLFALDRFQPGDSVNNAIGPQDVDLAKVSVMNLSFRDKAEVEPEDFSW